MDITSLPSSVLWTTPAAHPPPGHVSNLINPSTNKYIVQVTSIIFLAIATICVALRLYVQFHTGSHKLGCDDFALLLALVSLIFSPSSNPPPLTLPQPLQVAYTGILFWLSEVGYIARHAWDTPLAVIVVKLPHWTRVINTIPQPLTALVKLSILFFYLRVFGVDRTVRNITIFGICFVSVVYVAFTVTFSVLTSVNDPIVERLSITQGAVNVATDLFLLILPISSVLKLHMAWGRKIAVLGIFSTGVGALLLSTLTLYWRTTTTTAAIRDSTWLAATIFTVLVVEIDIGIIVSCLPLFAPLIPRVGQLTKNWTNYLRSKGSLLFLISSRKSHSTSRHQPEISHEDGAEAASNNKGAAYIELAETSHKASKAARKHWFDRSIAGVSTLGNTTATTIDEQRTLV
ncbi:hypothetical protein F4823DRAFT_638157 [Ustulina deusta]|nr:hypothetical protein F4823DRAFT_638157 [Ustulina deusta]